MTKIFNAAATIAALCASLATAPAAVAGIYIRGWELRGHSMRVDTDGVISTIHFGKDGRARIVSESGAEAHGNWFVENRQQNEWQLCLDLDANVRECWPYRQSFTAGEPLDLTSSCSVTSRFTPLSVGPDGIYGSSAPKHTP